MTEDKKPEDYSPVPIAQVKPDHPLCVDIYLQIGEKFLKFKHQGDEIPGDKYNELIARNLKHIFIDTGHISEFATWMKKAKAKSIDQMVDKVGEKNRDLAEAREAMSEAVYEVYAEEELSTETVELLQKQAEELIAKVSKNKPTAQILAMLTKQNSSVADHSVNVANISVFLAMVMGNNHHAVLENIYMGALFHDYGKAKIPPDVLNNTSGNKYSQAIQDHPIKGAASLKKLKGINKPVLDIVIQHHEQANGKGFPLSLKGDEIYGLAKIVSIANVFDNTCLENSKKDESEMYKSAIKVIEYDNGRRFDPALLPRVVDALKLVYGNFYRERQPKS